MSNFIIVLSTLEIQAMYQQESSGVNVRASVAGGALRARIGDGSVSGGVSGGHVKARIAYGHTEGTIEAGTGKARR